MVVVALQTVTAHRLTVPWDEPCSCWTDARRAQEAYRKAHGEYWQPSAWAEVQQMRGRPYWLAAEQQR